MLDLIAFFRKKYPEYVQLGLSVIPENKVTIAIDGKNYETIFFHLLYEPQLIGILIPDTLVGCNDFEKISNLSFPKNDPARAAFTITCVSKIDCDDQAVLLCKVGSVQLKKNWFEHWYVNRFFQRALAKNNYVIDHFDAAVFDKMLIFFRYPKPVFVICTSSERANSFPVDTCRKVGNYYVFGVRESNRIMSKVAIGDQFSIGISDFEKRNLIYQLGNYSDADSPVSYLTDDPTGIRIPEVVSDYTIVALKQIIRFENQSVFVAHTVSETVVLNPSKFLAHIHKFWLLSKNIRKQYL